MQFSKRLKESITGVKTVALIMLSAGVVQTQIINTEMETPHAIARTIQRLKPNSDVSRSFALVAAQLAGESEDLNSSAGIKTDRLKIVTAEVTEQKPTVHTPAKDEDARLSLIEEYHQLVSGRENSPQRSSLLELDPKHALTIAYKATPSGMHPVAILGNENRVGYMPEGSLGSPKLN